MKPEVLRRPNPQALNRQSSIVNRQSESGVSSARPAFRAARGKTSMFCKSPAVENRGLNFALMEGYHTALMKGRFPVCCLFLEINPAAVDVNIHPAKREVKFHREAEVRRLVAQAVRETLLKFHSAAAAESKVQSPRPKVEAIGQTFEVKPRRHCPNFRCR